MDISNTSAAQIAQTLAVGGSVGNSTVYRDLNNMFCASYDNFERSQSNYPRAPSPASAPVIGVKPPPDDDLTTVDDDQRWIEALAEGCLAVASDDNVPLQPQHPSEDQSHAPPEPSKSAAAPAETSSTDNPDGGGNSIVALPTTASTKDSDAAAADDDDAMDDDDADDSSDDSSSGSDSSSDEDEPDAASDGTETPAVPDDDEPMAAPPPLDAVVGSPGSPSRGRKRHIDDDGQHVALPSVQPPLPMMHTMAVTERPIAVARARKLSSTLTEPQPSSPPTAPQPSSPQKQYEFGFEDLQIKVIDDLTFATATNSLPQQDESPQAKLMRSVAAQQRAVENQLRNEKPPAPVAAAPVAVIASRNSNSRKRATPPAPVTVTLLQFVRMLNDTFANIRVGPDGDYKINLSAIKRELDLTEAEAFNAHVPVRVVSDKQTTNGDASAGTATTPAELPPSVAYSLLNLCYNKLMMQLEADGRIMAFPRDGFKYLLAHYEPFLTAANFSGTNAVRSNHRSGKSNSVLANGQTISEFIKSPDNFALCLGRTDKHDLEAYKLVVRLGLQLNDDVFRHYLWLEFKQPKYESDSVAKVRKDHACIPITNNSKLAIILVTRDVMLMYDAAAPIPCFAPVLLNVDRKIPYSIRRNLGHSDHLVLEVLLGTKLRIVDLLDAYIYQGGKEPRPCVDPLPDTYAGRIDIIRQLIDTVPVVTPSSASESELVSQGGYLQKPLQGPPTVGFQYHRVHHTVAIVGTFQTDALYAYRAGPNTLEVNASRTPITGGTAMLITSQAQRAKRFCQETRDLTPTTIMMCGKEYILTGDIPPDARIFDKVIVVELIDNRLAGLSERLVWHLEEVRGPQKVKDPHNDLLSVVGTKVRDPLFRKQLMEMLHNAAPS